MGIMFLIFIFLLLINFRFTSKKLSFNIDISPSGLLDSHARLEPDEKPDEKPGEKPGEKPDDEPNEMPNNKPDEILDEIPDDI